MRVQSAILTTKAVQPIAVMAIVVVYRVQEVIYKVGPLCFGKNMSRVFTILKSMELTPVKDIQIVYFLMCRSLSQTGGEEPMQKLTVIQDVIDDVESLLYDRLLYADFDWKADFKCLCHVKQSFLTENGTVSVIPSRSLTLL